MASLSKQDVESAKSFYQEHFFENHKGNVSLRRTVHILLAQARYYNRHHHTIQLSTWV